LLGPYRILGRLGAGGMGVVYKAQDTRLGRTVAIKVLSAEALPDPERTSRFLQEARAVSALDHPNIVTLYDLAEAEGVHFIVMQYVAGKTLRQLLEHGPLPLDDALSCAMQIADALARVHAIGMVHRDLKPENVMVADEGLVKILDFGLAKLIERSETSGALTLDAKRRETQEGYILGTTPYMSPEQAQGRKVDARTDVFSFGSVLYEMVTGRRAFAGESVAAVLAAVIRGEPTPVTELVPGVPPELDKLISRALRKDVERRSQSMADVRVALAEILEDLESGKSIVKQDARVATLRIEVE